MKNRRLLVIAVALVGVILAAVLIGEPKAKPKPTVVKATQSACGPYRIDRSIRVSSEAINVEIPKNPAEFDKGLGGRPCILPNQGMLFAFTKSGQYAFWMKGMKFPIDIIWISAGHKIVAMEIDESPKTYPDKFENKTPAQFVLEIKANRSKELGLKLGSAIYF